MLYNCIFMRCVCYITVYSCMCVCYITAYSCMCVRVITVVGVYVI